MSDELQDAIDTVMDGNKLREMTRHNAAEFALAMATLVEAARRDGIDIAAKVAAAEKIRVLRDTANFIGSDTAEEDTRWLAQTLLREWADILETELGVDQDTEHTPWATA